MRRLWKLVVVFVVAALIVPLIGCGEEAPPEARPYKIGFLATASGYAAPVGIIEKEAWLLAVEHINAEGGVNGHLLEAVVYDDGSDESKAAVLAKKMVTEDKVLVVGKCEPPSPCLAAQVITEGEGVPFVAGTGEIALTVRPQNYTFTYVPDQTDHCGGFYQFCRTRGFTKAAYLGDSSSMGKGAKIVLEATASDFGIDIVDYEEYNPGDADMIPQLTKMKRAAPEVLWIEGFEMSSVLACEQAKALKIGVPIFVMVPTIAPEFLKAKPEALEGVFTLGTWQHVWWLLPENDPRRLAAEPLATAIKEKYGREMAPVDHIGYDDVLIMAEALRIAGLTNEDLADLKEARTKVRDAMETVNITGCFDSYDFGANGKTHRTCYPIRERTIITVKDGQRTFVQACPGELWPQVLDLYLQKIGQT